MLRSRSIRAKFLALVVPFALPAIFAVAEFKAPNAAAERLHDRLEKLVAIQSAAVSGSLWSAAYDQIKRILSALEIAGLAALLPISIVTSALVGFAAPSASRSS
jgi:hypothetical protein